MTLDQARPNDFDAVLLPGGAMNADALRMEKKAQEFVKNIDSAGKPIAVICHGPWLLISSGLTKGRHMTSYYTIQDDLKNAGAKWVRRSQCARPQLGEQPPARRHSRVQPQHARTVCRRKTKRPPRRLVQPTCQESPGAPGLAVFETWGFSSKRNIPPTSVTINFRRIPPIGPRSSHVFRVPRVSRFSRPGGFRRSLITASQTKDLNLGNTVINPD